MPNAELQAKLCCAEIWNYSPLEELRSISVVKVSLDDNSFSVTNSNCNRRLLVACWINFIHKACFTSTFFNRNFAGSFQ